MIGYTYFNNQNYQNYHSQQSSGYNSYMGSAPTNKFASNQLYGTNYTQAQPQIYNNMNPNKMSAQMPLNQVNQSHSINSAPIANNIVNQTISIVDKANPSIQNIAQNNGPFQKDSSIPSGSTAPTSTIKKPINLDAQSFIPKNLKKHSISSEKEAFAQTPKKEILEPQTKSAATAELSETETKPSSANDSVKSKSENISPNEKILTPNTERGSASKHSPENFALNKKVVSKPTEEKPQTATIITNSEAAKQKPESLLGSILSQPPKISSTSKQPDKTVVNLNSAPVKKKQNDVSKALEEKTKMLKEQEKNKKEEKLKEEIKQKQAASNLTASSNKKGEKTVRKVSKNDNESNEAKRAGNKEENNENLNKENEGPMSTEKKFTIENIYFKVYENEKSEDNKNRYSFDYLFSFRNWKICSETKLIEDLVCGHFRDLRETVEEVSSVKNQGRGNENRGFGKRGTKFSEEPVQPKISNENQTFQRSKIDLKPAEPKEIPSTETGEGLGKWGRKDLSKEEKSASDFKSNRKEEISKDPIRSKLTE